MWHHASVKGQERALSQETKANGATESLRKLGIGINTLVLHIANTSDVLLVKYSLDTHIQCNTGLYLHSPCLFKGFCQIQHHKYVTSCQDLIKTGNFNYQSILIHITCTLHSYCEMY